MAEQMEKVRMQLLEVVNLLSGLQEAEVIDVVISRSEEWMTYNAKVSLTNPYFTPIFISDVSYTLKTANSNRVIVSGSMEKRPEPLPGSEDTVLEVPIRVAHNQLMTLLEDNGGAQDKIYQLDLAVTVDLPLYKGHRIPLDWKGEIKIPH
ncbi:desiccation protectant protein Lea14 homolog [Vitis riparia]|uniref:desiccation protectant protein Lea14 homolog n=1 Tax=Vitis riparia TaxID=96939 RepID=UPI00155A7F92|nr:desiccation protectant protein Lea14 homolog [Vitis riparia]